MSKLADNTPDRAEEFIQLFNRVADYLWQLVNPEKFAAFGKLVDVAATRSAAVHANAAALKQFAMLRNAIVHDADYPPHIVAVPSSEALSKFKQVAGEVLEPKHLIPTFATRVRCFSLTDNLPKVLGFMREHDFSQVMVRNSGGRLGMLTVEGITWWLADNVGGDQNPVNAATRNLQLLSGLTDVVQGNAIDEQINEARDVVNKREFREAAILLKLVESKKGHLLNNRQKLRSPPITVPLRLEKTVWMMRLAASWKLSATLQKTNSRESMRYSPTFC